MEPPLNEPALIAAMRAIATHPAARGLADDAAVLEVGRETLVLTHDMMVEGVHWLPGQDMADVAFKLVAVNLSDLAAKGAEPLGVLLGYALGGGDARFMAGLAEALDRFGVPLLGGDTVAVPTGSARTMALTALGRATCHPVPSRSGALPGHRVWITGPLGGALAGFEALRADPAMQSAATLAFRRPVPRLGEGRALAAHVSAMMDISDGLLIDATRMASASAVTFALDSAAVPLAPGMAQRATEAMSWGDDYELLFTAPATFVPPCPAFAIGTVLPQSPHPLLLDGTAPEGRLGWQHSAGSDADQGALKPRLS